MFNPKQAGPLQIGMAGGNFCLGGPVYLKLDVKIVFGKISWYWEENWKKPWKQDLHKKCHKIYFRCDISVLFSPAAN